MRIVEADGSLSLPKDVQEVLITYMLMWIQEVYSGSGLNWYQFYVRTYCEMFEIEGDQWRPTQH